jgi:ferredoxin
LENKGQKKLSRRELLAKLSPLGRVEQDTAKCTGCGLCARECPTGALEALTDAEAGTFRLLFKHGVCVACGGCVKICPERALTVERGLEPESLGRVTILFEDELIKCSECGAPVGPRRMVEKMRARVKTVRSELCIACKSQSWYSLVKDNGRHP